MEIGGDNNELCIPENGNKNSEKGDQKKTIASRLGISERCLYNKMKGKTPFTWSEVEILQEVFFPDMTKEEIMFKSNELEKDAI